MFSLKLKPPVLLTLAIGLFAVLAAACGNGQIKSGAETKPKPVQTVTVSPAEQAKLAELNLLADDVYKLTLSGSYMEARSRLYEMSALATRIQYAGVTTIEGVHALTETLTDAQRAFNAVRLQTAETKQLSAKVKLTADALNHKNEPMWLQYERVMQEDAQALNEGLRTKDAKTVQEAVGGLKAHYDMIRAAVIISREPLLNEKMDSLLTFLTNQSRAQPLPLSNLEQAATQLRDVLGELFGRQDATAYVPIIDQHPPLLWTVIIATVIAAVLAYAAWQMLRDGRGEVPIRKKEQG